MLRKEVLHCFRILHKTRKQVFKEDEYTLKEARKRINDEFKRNRNETDVEKIQELLKVGKDVETILRTTVVQAKLNKEGNFEVHLTKDTQFFKNVPYKDT